MTKQIKFGMGRHTFGWSISNRTRKFLFALLSSVILLQIQSKVQAQANLVNLYDWSNETQLGYDPNPNDYVNISSFNSANFYGDLSPNGFAVPIVSGSLNTVPGTTYEISFTLQNNFITSSHSRVYFGSTFTDIDLPPEGSGYPAYPSPVPVNVDFTVMATSSITPMSIAFGLDSSGADSLYNFKVTEATVTAAPETSSANLFVLGLVSLFAWKSRRLLQMPARKLVAAR